MEENTIEQLIDRLRRRVLREITRTLTELEMLHTDLTPDGTIRPLYTVYEHPDHYKILVDLPAADTSTVNVTATEDTLIIEAQLEKAITYSDLYGTAVGREVTITRYRNIIPLPEDADPKGIKVQLRPNKILEITIPKKTANPQD